MNKLPINTQVQIIHLLCEGNSLRATARLTDTSFNTVVKLLIAVGKACMKFHDERVINIPSKKIQCDEIWSFVYAKEKNVPKEEKSDGVGDVWTWTAIDADTKLIVSWFVGAHTTEAANLFMQDVAGRLKNRVQLTTDGFRFYTDAVEDGFNGKVDYAQLMKVYGLPTGESGAERKYSPPECIDAKKIKIFGNPKDEDISTSYVERQNLTMRMHMRRFTRLTNAFSKKIENHCYAIALYFVYYNFCKIHKTLRVTPAMEAGLMKDVLDIERLIKMSEK